MSGDVYLEFISVGTSIKATAIDSKTGREVSIVAPQTASQDEITRIAVAKLKRVLAKEASEAEKLSAKTMNGRLV